MITMKDIAEKAGVSRTTVSFVLNKRCHRDQRISESVQKRVLATAKQLGYMRNDLVLSLVKGRSHAVGIVSKPIGRRVQNRRYARLVKDEAS